MIWHELIKLLNSQCDAFAGSSVAAKKRRHDLLITWRCSHFCHDFDLWLYLPPHWFILCSISVRWPRFYATAVVFNIFILVYELGHLAILMVFGTKIWPWFQKKKENVSKCLMKILICQLNITMTTTHQNLPKKSYSLEPYTLFLTLESQKMLRAFLIEL